MLGKPGQLDLIRNVLCPLFAYDGDVECGVGPGVVVTYSASCTASRQRMQNRNRKPLPGVRLNSKGSCGQKLTLDIFFFAGSTKVLRSIWSKVDT
jgi:hypothetical protein